MSVIIFGQAPTYLDVDALPVYWGLQTSICSTMVHQFNDPLPKPSPEQDQRSSVPSYPRIGPCGGGATSGIAPGPKLP